MVQILWVRFSCHGEDAISRKKSESFGTYNLFVSFSMFPSYLTWKCYCRCINVTKHFIIIYIFFWPLVVFYNHIFCCVQKLLDEGWDTLQCVLKKQHKIIRDREVSIVGFPLCLWYQQAWGMNLSKSTWYKISRIEWALYPD